VSSRFDVSLIFAWIQLTKPTLNKQRDKGDPEDEEDGDDTTLDPLEHWLEVVATRLPRQNVSCRVVLADPKLLVERSEEDEREHKDLDRHHDELSSVSF
jgi:hypothetical protein